MSSGSTGRRSRAIAFGIASERMVHRFRSTAHGIHSLTQRPLLLTATGSRMDIGPFER